MEFNGLFRRSLFGGYNKKDVEGYLDTLAKEMQNWKQEKETPPDAALEKAREEISQLKEELGSTRAELADLQERKDGELCGKGENEENSVQLTELRAKEIEILQLNEELEKMRAQLADLQEGKGERQGKEEPDGCLQPPELQEMRDENKQLRERVRQMEEDYKGVLGERELISRILHDARDKADLVLEDANLQAREILEDANLQARGKLVQADEDARKVVKSAESRVSRQIEDVNKELEEKRRVAYDYLRKELEEQMINFITVKYKIADYVKSINSMEGDLKKVAHSLQTLYGEMPARVNNILEGVEEDSTLEDTRRWTLAYEDNENSEDSEENENSKNSENATT